VSTFVGTAALTRFALRRDRVLLPAWVAVFVLMTVFSASATMALYPDEALRIVAASSVNDVPVAVAIYGRIWDPTSLGALSLLKLGALGAALIAVLAVMLVIRHTRADEERGRTELLGATVVGERAGLAAGVIVASIAMGSIGVLSALGLTAVGLPASGSWAFGLGWATTGISFVAIAAVCAQLTSSSRAANAIAMGAVAALYLLRAIGDVAGGEQGPSFLSWLSPIGWGQQVRPYAGDRFLVLLVPIVFAGLVLWAASAISARRDLGAGVLPDRVGPATAAGWLASPWLLAWRLQRGLLLGWAIAYVIFGAILGSIVSDLTGMFDSPQVVAMIKALGGTGELIDAFIAMEFSIVAFMTASYGIAVARRLSTEEADGHAEPVLATAVSRTAFLGSHVVIALLGATLLCLVQGVALGLANAASIGTTDRLGAVVGASLAYLPAIWTITGVAVLLFGALPRLAYLAWVVVVALLLVSELGAMLSWPQWILDSSPFAHIPRLPTAPMEWTPLVVLTLVAAALIAIGTVRFQQRDLDTP
jgi:ABC-2 type transport system permease protein